MEGEGLEVSVWPYAVASVCGRNATWRITRGFISVSSLLISFCVARRCVRPTTRGIKVLLMAANWGSTFGGWRLPRDEVD